MRLVERVLPAAAYRQWVLTVPFPLRLRIARSGAVAHVLHVQASVDGFVRLGYLLHFVTLGEQAALAEGGYLVLVGVPDPLRARLQKRSH